MVHICTIIVHLGIAQISNAPHRRLHFLSVNTDNGTHSLPQHPPKHHTTVGRKKPTVAMFLTIAITVSAACRALISSSPYAYGVQATLTAEGSAVAQGSGKAISETFYRAMSHAEYAAFKANNNGLTYLKGKELFVATDVRYSQKFMQKEGYDVLMQIDAKAGTMEALKEAGVRNQSKLTDRLFSEMPLSQPGWAERGQFLFKGEKSYLNIGIMSNTENFNNYIIGHSIIP